MTVSASLTDGGQHHATTSGTVTTGAGIGEVPAVAANQLLQILLPFEPKVMTNPGFEEQFYIFFRSTDGNIADARLDATQFGTDPATGRKTVRLRVDMLAAPAAIECWLETHHSIGR